MNIELKDYPEIKAVILAAFPGYRKKQAGIESRESFSMHGTYWDGGSRNEYAAVDLVSMRSKGAPQYPPTQFGGPGTQTMDIPLNVAIVEAGTFCGKPATARVLVRAENFARLLPEAVKEVA